MAYFRKNTRNQEFYFRKLSQLPFGFITLVLLITSIGLLMMYTAARGSIHPWLVRQLIHLAIFLPIMVLIAIVDIRLWFRTAYLLYGLTVMLLAFTEISGHTAMGATRWINLGFMKLQPSELMKPCLVLALAKYFNNITFDETNKTVSLIAPIIMILVPFLLILKQPDLGTGGILLLIGVMMFFAAAVSYWKFAIVGLLGLVSLPFAWNFLHDYQKKRVLTFLNPENDPLGAGYNIIQSKIAIGSGGLAGKGLLQGSQSQLNFLPERQTDFIFTMFAEEMGFLGGIVLISLYAAIIYYGIYVAVNCRNHYGRLVAIGTTSLFFLHVFINIAMVAGLLPVVGVPLPLLSYGGTIMMTVLIGFGFIINAHIHANVNIGGNNRQFF